MGEWMDGWWCCYACAVHGLTVPPMQGLPKQVYKDKRRLLRKMEAQLAAKKKEEKAKEITQRFKGVRFIERKKLTRRRQQIEKQVATVRLVRSDGWRAGCHVGFDTPVCVQADKKAIPALLKEAKQLTDNINYINWYPQGQQYFSVFPPPSGSVAEKPSQTRRCAASRCRPLCAVSHTDDVATLSQPCSHAQMGPCERSTPAVFPGMSANGR